MESVPGNPQFFNWKQLKLIFFIPPRLSGSSMVSYWRVHGNFGLCNSQVEEMFDIIDVDGSDDVTEAR
jgi:hypothetical protein